MNNYDYLVERRVPKGDYELYNSSLHLTLLKVSLLCTRCQNSHPDPAADVSAVVRGQPMLQSSFLEHRVSLHEHHGCFQDMLNIWKQLNSMIPG